MIDQFEDVTMSRVLRALGERGVFGASEFASEPVEQAVDPQPLPVIELHTFYAFPEARFAKHGA